MQDEYGRPLSDDGAWVWDGSGWRPTGGPGAGGGTGLEPTMLAPNEYDPRTGPAAGGAPVGYPYGSGGGAGPYGPGAAGAYGPGTPGGYGAPPPPPPFYKRPAVIIGALLVLSAVLVTVILLTRSDNNTATPPVPTTAPATTPVPTTEPTAGPTTDTPTAPPVQPTSAPPTDIPTSAPAAPTTIASGAYECTQGGSVIGTATFSGNAYVTDTGGSGVYTYDPASGDISFTGGDLGDYTGTYDPNGPSMDLTSNVGTSLHCAQ